MPSSSSASLAARPRSSAVSVPGCEAPSTAFSFVATLLGPSVLAGGFDLLQPARAAGRTRRHLRILVAAAGFGTDLGRSLHGLADVFGLFHWPLLFELAGVGRGIDVDRAALHLAERAEADGRVDLLRAIC